MLNHQQIIDLFNFRHATKLYDANKKLPREHLETILEAGRLSPSSFGFEPWKFIAIINPELKALIAANSWGAKEKIESGAEVVLILKRTAKHLEPNSAYLEQLLTQVHQMPPAIKELYQSFYTQFVASAVEHSPMSKETFLEQWAGKQTYIALANMLTTAALLGVDSTPVDGFETHLEDLLHSAGIFNKEDYSLSVIALFGYRAEEPRAKTRQSKKAVIEIIE